MEKNEHIVSYSAEELATMKSETDWAKVDATTQEEVERHAEADEGALPEGWEKTAVIGLPPGKEAVKLRIDRDVLDWFRGTGSGYQTRMNNVLRAFVSSRQVGGHQPK
ncbi:MAG: BrnA antitoxin family protein [Azospirillaceae bacterium]|nr:BrnA antitoxin family protein [Azospirillaceae bacterium]